MGIDAAWTAGEHLQAAEVDLLAAGNWQRGNGQGRKPEPLERPSDIHRKAEREAKTIARAEKFRRKHGTPIPEED